MKEMSAVVAALSEGNIKLAALINTLLKAGILMAPQFSDEIRDILADIERSPNPEVNGHLDNLAGFAASLSGTSSVAAKPAGRRTLLTLVKGSGEDSTTT